jgi:polar amino acid transport system substrate-binding protein
MKQGKLLIACLVALCLVLPVIAAADTLDDIKARGVLLVGMEPGYMPFELTNQKGEIIGFDVDMAKRMAKALGVKLELVSTAWDGIIPSLVTNKFDIIMSGMTITEERAKTVDFANPYIIIGQTVLVRKELADQVKSYKDLNDPKYKVASKLGTTGEVATKKMIPNAQYFSYETEKLSTARLTLSSMTPPTTP